MRTRLYIDGTRMGARPDSRRTVFADGAGEGAVREDRDLELSHWIPNRTPTAYKADTSTEICMNYVASGTRDYDLVVNNHADVDGVLSVFTLLEPEVALTHRATIVSAAEMGDFAAWGERTAQVLFQSLTWRLDALEETGTDPQLIYEKALEHVGEVIGRGFADGEVESSLAPLERSVEWIDAGRIRRQEIHARFVHYAVPAGLCGDRLDAALCLPKFNEAISDAVLFWPQARARTDREKVQLVSVESPGGWYHDLWYPGYLWADTPHSWRAPGLDFSSNAAYRFSYPPLDAAVEDLQARERADVTWRLETELSLFGEKRGRGYPVILSVMSGDRPAASSLTPELVARRLAEVYQPL